MSISVKDASKSFSCFGDFAATDNPSSSFLTPNQLDWKPTQPGLLADLGTASPEADKRCFIDERLQPSEDLGGTEFIA